MACGPDSFAVDWGWNPHSVFSVLAMFLAWALAALVYLTRPERPQNRALAVALFLAGAANGAYFVFRLLMPQASDAYRMLAVGMTFLLLLPASYLWFVGTLRTPIVGWIRRPVGLAALITYTGLVETAWFARPDWFIDRMVFSPGVHGWQFEPGPLLQLPLGVLGAAQVFGLVAGISAFRRAETHGVRRQSAAFAVAFGTRDALQVAFIVSFGFLGGIATPIGSVAFEYGISGSDALFMVLVAYGILQTQLFDIDLKIKASLRRGVLASFFVVTFFLAEQAGEFVLQSRTNSFWLGLGAAAGMALALVPLRRLAARVANVAMPGVQATADYIGVRKHEVYEEAAEGVMIDGNVTPKERATLDRLRDKLGITGGEAQVIEARVLARLTARASAAAPPPVTASGARRGA